MAVAAAALAVGGAVIGGIAKKKQADAKADELRSQAAREGVVGAAKEDDWRRQVSAAMGASIAAGGSSGVTAKSFDAGRAAFAQRGELGALRIQADTIQRVKALGTSADNVKKAGNMALLGSMFSAGAAFLGAAGGGGGGGGGGEGVTSAAPSLSSGGTSVPHTGGLQLAPRTGAGGGFF